MTRTSKSDARLLNLRDVGGLPTRDGAVTRSGVLLRSDAPPSDTLAPELDGWPPALVLDLRSPDEVGDPHPLAGIAGAVVSLPLATPDQASEATGLRSLYRSIVDERGAMIGAAVRAIAEATGAVLVHCASGKDRTGIVVATTLAAVGVEPEAILDDYQRTAPNLAALLRRQSADPSVADRVATLMAERPDLMTTPRPAMKAVLDRLDDAGGARAWLADQGLGGGTLSRLEERLVGDRA